MDSMQRLEKKVETLLRENEKLKNDVKNSRKNAYGGGIGAGPGGYAAGLGGANVGGQGGVNFHAAMVGKHTADKYGGVNKSTVLGAGVFSGGIGNLLGKNDGSGTDRSTYHFQTPYGGAGVQPPREDKSFVSPGGGQPTHGAVSALNLAGAGLTGGAPMGTGNNNNNMLDNSLMKNILNTPSSGKSKSGIS